jgi:hypothetical protein
MFPLIAVIVPDSSRGETAGGAARLYSATRTNVETSPLTAAEQGAKSRGRRPGQRHRQRSPMDDPEVGTNLDIEI